MSDRRNRGPAVQMDFAEEGPDRRPSPYDDGSQGGVDGPLRHIYVSDPSDPDSGIVDTPRLR